MPVAQTRGMSPDTWALFVESVTSAIILLMTPMFPSSKPAMQRLFMEGVNDDRSVKGSFEYLTTSPL